MVNDISDWWFGTWLLFFPSSWEWKIIPTDFHSMIFRGRHTTKSIRQLQALYVNSRPWRFLYFWIHGLVGTKILGKPVHWKWKPKKFESYGVFMGFPHGETWLHNAPSASKLFVMGVGELITSPCCRSSWVLRSLVVYVRKMLWHRCHFTSSAIRSPSVPYFSNRNPGNQVPYGCCGTLVSNRSALRYGSTGTPWSFFVGKPGVGLSARECSVRIPKRFWFSSFPNRFPWFLWTRSEFLVMFCSNGWNPRKIAPYPDVVSPFGPFLWTSNFRSAPERHVTMAGSRNCWVSLRMAVQPKIISASESPLDFIQGWTADGFVVTSSR